MHEQAFDEYTHRDGSRDGIITKRTLTGSIIYSYDKEGQLKKYDSSTYTYNANGIRTGKTVSVVKHSYRLDGTKILSEKWGTNILTPLYDNKEEVCGIVFNGASYYFLKNLQGAFPKPVNIYRLRGIHEEFFIIGY